MSEIVDAKLRIKFNPTTTFRLEDFNPIGGPWQQLDIYIQKDQSNKYAGKSMEYQGDFNENTRFYWRIDTSKLRKTHAINLVLNPCRGLKSSAISIIQFITFYPLFNRKDKFFQRVKTWIVLPSRLVTAPLVILALEIISALGLIIPKASRKLFITTERLAERFNSLSPNYLYSSFMGAGCLKVYSIDSTAVPGYKELKGKIDQQECFALS